MDGLTRNIVAVAHQFMHKEGFKGLAELRGPRTEFPALQGGDHPTSKK